MERRRSSPVALELAALADIFRDQGVLSVKDALSIIHEAQDVMNDEPNMVHVEGTTIYVFGDIHGQFFDLLQLVQSVGLDNLSHKDIRMVFLGDYVDRGAFSCEVILYLLLLKIRFPTKVVLLRGNHECETISSFYGFRNECRVKYGLSAYYHFISCFQSMPIAALLTTSKGNLLCVHGGLSPEVADLQAIDKIDRRREVPMEGPLCDLLWSDPVVDHQDDPTVEAQWTANTVRGCSFYFNASALFTFLAKNDLLCVIRAHEYEQNGYMYHFGTDNYEALDTRNDKSVAPLITVFSAPNYCDTNGNKAGYLIVHSDPFRIQVQQVETVGHPIPGLASIERSADIWRQFKQTLPFLPASKDFFEEVLHLASKQRKRANQSSKTPSFLSSRSGGGGKMPVGTSNTSGSGGASGKWDALEPVAADEDPIEAQRRRTSEMHPQAIRRVLDEEASKWMQSDDDDGDDKGGISVYPAHEITLPEDHGSHGINYTQYRTQSLAPPEMEMMKLIFSLLDTDGSMTLTAPEVVQFVFNILGERIGTDVAEIYLDALDFDRNGVVDFSDILSWGAVLKANYDRQNESVWSVSFLTRYGKKMVRKLDPHRGFLWLTVAFIIHDVVIKKRTRLLQSKSMAFLIVIALVLYMRDAVRFAKSLQLIQWCELVPFWKCVAKWRKKQTQICDKEK